MSRCVCVMLLCLFGGWPAWAEMSGDDYRSDAIIQTPEEREQVRRLIEQARSREAARALERQREAERRQAELAAREAARPPGARLLRAHCTRCHTLEASTAPRYGRLGWWWVVTRMRWLNGADIPPGAAAEIVAHLSAHRPATTGRAWLEGGMLMALAAAALAGGWLGVRQIRSRKKK